MLTLNPPKSPRNSSSKAITAKQVQELLMEICIALHATKAVARKKLAATK